MRLRIGLAFILFAASACSARLRPAPAPAPAQSTEPLSVAALTAQIDADSKRSDHASDSKIRGDLAAEADRDADRCLARDPLAVACLYGRAVADGLMARAHPTRAGEYLSGMLDYLARAETADSGYDEAGPARVRALVLIRAPGWPLGPGDIEAGLIAARRAVALRPQYPPNLLALAEAQAKSGDAAGARDSFVRARETALALPHAADPSDAADREDWLRQATQGLQHE